jgi:hypothetical protein
VKPHDRFALFVVFLLVLAVAFYLVRALRM